MGNKLVLQFVYHSLFLLITLFFIVGFDFGFFSNSQILLKGTVLLYNWYNRVLVIPISWGKWCW